MNEVALELLNNNSWLVWPLACLSSISVITLLVLASNASIRGRLVKAGPVTIGEKPASPEELSPTQVININPVQLTADQLDQVAEMFAERMREVEQERESEPADYLYDPTDLPAVVIRFFKIRVDIENKLRNIVMSHGGSWAGSSLAQGEDFLQLAADNNLISEELASDISLFYWELRPYMAGYAPLDDTAYQIDYLATRIISKLEQIEAGIR